MMEAILPRSRMEEFERVATARREDVAYREKSIRFETRQREGREERAEEQRERETSAALDMALTSTEQIVTFKVDLDRYDAKTVEALMDNQEALEAVREKIDSMLEEATVLPDGRRAFKTKDGKRVFDEHGKELSPAIIDPSSIDNSKPDWETFSGFRNEHRLLTQERLDLQTYQAKLDDVRDRLDKGGVTSGDLKDMKAGLRAEMPDAVQAKLELEKPDAIGVPKLQNSAVSLSDATDDLMRKTGLSSSRLGLSP